MLNSQILEDGSAASAASCLEREDRLHAIALLCCAVALFALLDTSAKYLTAVENLPVTEVIWMRFAVNALLIAAVLRPVGLRRYAPSRQLKVQILRSLFLLGSTAFNFLALQFLQLDQTATVFFLSPFVVAALAGPLLGEWVGWRRLLAICVGFSGVLFVMRPGFGGVHWAISFSFLSTLSYGLYSLATRYLAKYDSAKTTLIYTPVVGVIAFAPFALMAWQSPIHPSAWMLLFATGILGGLGHWLLILAYQRAPAPVLAPFNYVNIVFMIALGYMIFGDIPGVWTLIGAAIIISSGVYLLLRERRASRSPARSSPSLEG